MSSKNFTVKNGISVGSNEVISANGDMIVHGNLMIGDHMLVSSTGDLTVPGSLVIGDKAIESNVNDHANSAYNQANTATLNAGSSSSYANSAYLQANTATTNAATADQRAVTSGVYANAAFITANTKFNSTGGTISGDVNITGNLNITGNTVTHASDSLVINDPLILLANNNPGNLLDTGFIAHYIEGGTTKHTGLVRDSSANTYYLFDSYVPHIQETNILDPNDATLRITTLRSNLIADSVAVANTGTFGNLSYTGTLTGGTGVVNIGSGQVYKDANGNVGIGTISTTNGRINASAGTSATGNTLFLVNYDGTYNPYLQVQHNGVNGVKILNSSSFGGTAGNFTIEPAANLLFSNGGTERMRIDSAGNVGIGVVPRTDWLAAAKVIQFPTNHSIVQNSSLLYTFSNLYLGTDGNFRYTGSSVGGYFYSGAGNFAFARSLYTPTSDAIAVTTNMLSMSASTGIVTIGALSAGSITETSSIVYKENVNPIMSALDSILQLTGVTYDRKDGSSANEAGLIAEEVNEVLPNIVTKNEEGKPEGIQYTKLTAYLIECIKELKSEIDMLKGK
jgi:hypothetical protein